MSYRHVVFASGVVAALGAIVAGQVRTAPKPADANASLQSQVRVLMDRQEIHDQMMRYARGIDRDDPALTASIYWPDAIIAPDERNVTTGADMAKRSTAAGRKPTEKRKQVGQHFVGNEAIEVDGDKAYAEFYFMSNTPMERGGEEYLRYRAGRYIDRWERRNGQWKIAYRVFVDDWDRLDKVVESAPGSNAWRRGDFGDKDPSATMKSGATHDAEAVMRAKVQKP
jgi:hypothetical protein